MSLLDDSFKYIQETLVELEQYSNAYKELYKASVSNDITEIAKQFSVDLKFMGNSVISDMPLASLGVDVSQVDQVQNILRQNLVATALKIKTCWRRIAEISARVAKHCSENVTVPEQSPEQE